MTDDKKECLRCGRVAEVGHKYGGGLIFSGYWASRFTQSVLRELRDLGFTISGDGGDVVISWDTKQSQSERI